MPYCSCCCILGTKKSSSLNREKPARSRLMESRAALRFKAAWWRAGQRAGMALHRFANPEPPSHSHKHTIRATLSKEAGSIDVYLYTPKDYQQHKSGKKYPLLVNFHGGGFTLGGGTDDCRWFGAVMETTDAIIATVDYRLAPEYPFPTAVEDGADAVIWLVSEAEKLGIDVDRGIAMCGFSAGANLAFTVPLKIDQLRQHPTYDTKTDEAVRKTKIAAVISWYPPTNYTISRPERNATNPRPEAGLPGYLTSLFDRSYLYPPGCESNVLVSPALATDEELRRVLPRDIWIYTCEYDDLCNEGRDFAERLKSLGYQSEEANEGDSDLGDSEGTERSLEIPQPISADSPHLRTGEKVVRYNMIPGVPHAWDKAPNPLWVNEIARERYLHAVEGLKEVWDTTARRQ